MGPLMIETVILPLLLQSIPLPDEFYESEFSDPTLAIVDSRDETDSAAMVRALEQRADEGDDSALEVLGEVFSHGLFGVTRDPVRACAYFERLDGRRPDGLHSFASCLFHGDGGVEDMPRARELYADAARAGYIKSFCALGNMLVRGQGGEADAEEGLRLCRAAAAAGDADAQADYGIYLLTGEGVERDPVAARFILEQAGDQGQRNAAFLLGQIHSKGDGTPVDHLEAADWFERAYVAGRPDAAFEAARSYLRLGYRTEEDGGMTLAPDYLNQGREWLVEARKVEPQDSPRRADIDALIENTDVLIRAAEDGDARD